MREFIDNTMVDGGKNDNIIISVLLWHWTWVGNIFFGPWLRIYFFFVPSFNVYLSGANWTRIPLKTCLTLTVMSRALVSKHKYYRFHLFVGFTLSLAKQPEQFIDIDSIKKKKKYLVPLLRRRCNLRPHLSFKIHVWSTVPRLPAHLLLWRMTYSFSLPGAVSVCVCGPSVPSTWNFFQTKASLTGY